MFSKEQSRLLREEFWTSFGKSFPRKWILYNTKIKGFCFKFYFDNSVALVALDIEGDIEHRIRYWDKLLALKSILVNNYLPETLFEETYFLENGKEISRIYIPLNEKVSIHNKNNWQQVMVFFNATMLQFEAFYNDYKEVVES